LAITALTALGGAEAQLEYHVRIGLNVGLEAAEIVETIVQRTPFVGFARALKRATGGQACLLGRASRSADRPFETCPVPGAGPVQKGHAYGKRARSPATRVTGARRSK
jgi:hypothetical protein